MTSCSCLDIVFRCHLHWSTRLSYQQASQTNADNTNSSSISSHPKRLTNSIDSCSSRVEDLYVRRRHAIGYSPQHQQLGSSARHQARLAAATCSSRQWHRVIITARLQRQEGVMWWTLVSWPMAHFWPSDGREWTCFIVSTSIHSMELSADMFINQATTQLVKCIASDKSFNMRLCVI